MLFLTPLGSRLGGQVLEAETRGCDGRVQEMAHVLPEQTSRLDEQRWQRHGTYYNSARFSSSKPIDLHC